MNAIEIRKKLKHLALALMLGAGLGAGSAQAQAIIEESFDYPAGNLAGNDGGTGFSGPWAATLRNGTINAPSNFWGSLAWAGTRCNSQAWSILNRPIGTTLTDAGVMANGATLWFSYVEDILNQNETNLDFNFALCSGNFSTNYPDKEQLLGATSEGIGVGNFRPFISAAYWQDSGDADGLAERVMSRDTSAGQYELDYLTNPRVLIVGKIEWGATDTDNETLTLYTADKDRNLGTPFVNAWSIPPLNQSLFDRISIEWKDSQPSIDEIRFGATSAEVLPPDTTAPTFDQVASTPPDDNTNAGRYVLQAVFNEPVSIGAGNIDIVNDTDGGATTSIAVGDSQVVVSGQTLTITLATPLLVSKNYHVEMGSGVVKNGANIDFGGIADDTTWNFTTTADGTLPTISSTDPADNAPGVAPYATLVATFGEDVQLTGAGTVTIRDVALASDKLIITLPDSRVSVSGADLSINLYENHLAANTEYAVQISDNAVLDLNLNPFAGIADDTTWSFTTAAPLSGGGVVVTADHINGVPVYGVTGTLYAIDPPYQPAIPVAGPVGPDWPDNGDDGWRMLSGSNLEADHGASPWEPDGTPVAQGRNYRLNSTPGSTYTFDLPDGAVINAIYATWLSRGVSGAIWSYTEGAASDSNSVSMTSVPAADLALDWTDAGATVRTGNFQRVLVGPITVEGGDGFTLKAVRTGNTHQADAVVLDVGSGGGTPFATWIGGFTLTDTSFNGDDDGDNLGNGIEGFFGTDPSVGNAGLTQVGKSGNTVTFTHPNPDAADVLTDVTGSYEWSLDLVTWYADDGAEGPGGTTVTTVATPDSPDPNVTTVVATIAGTVPEKLFLRVVATQM